jgi:uncharacterized phage-associated protein
VQFEVDTEKATQALNYFARKQHDHIISKLDALKLIFFADRYHLRRYGRPVVGDAYFAMQYGPVASVVKDIVDAKAAPAVQRYADTFIMPIHNPSGPNPRALRSLRDVDPDAFSQTDLEALEFAYETFFVNFQSKLVDLTHAYPEWKKHELALASGESKRVQMDYADFFADPDPVALAEFGLDDPFRDDPEKLERTRELAEERARANYLLLHG